MKKVKLKEHLTAKNEHEIENKNIVGAIQTTWIQKFYSFLILKTNDFLKICNSRALY